MNDQPKPKPVILTAENGQVITFQAGEFSTPDKDLMDYLHIIFDDWEPEGYTPSLDLAMAEEAVNWVNGSIAPYAIESDPDVIY